MRILVRVPARLAGHAGQTDDTALHLACLHVEERPRIARNLLAKGGLDLLLARNVVGFYCSAFVCSCPRFRSRPPRATASAYLSTRSFICVLKSSFEIFGLVTIEG